MTQTTLIVLVIGVVVILIAIGLVAAFSRNRGPRLRALPDESRDRFARSWPMIEARFIEDPRGSVQEADKMAVMVLSERGAILDDHQRMPKDLQMARDAAASDEGRQGTEGMRVAMVHYRRIVDDAVGSERMRRPEREGRREVAS